MDSLRFAHFCFSCGYNQQADWLFCHFLTHVGVFFQCFRTPPNSDTNCRIFNVRTWSFCVHIHPVDVYDVYISQEWEIKYTVSCILYPVSCTLYPVSCMLVVGMYILCVETGYISICLHTRGPATEARSTGPAGIEMGPSPIVTDTDTDCFIISILRN